MTHRQAQGAINRAKTIYIVADFGGLAPKWVATEVLVVQKISAKRAIRRLHDAGIKDFECIMTYNEFWKDLRIKVPAFSDGYRKGFSAALEPFK